MTVLLFGDKYADIFNASNNINLHIFDCTLSKLIGDYSVRRKIENIINGYNSITGIIFYFGSCDNIEKRCNSQNIKKYIEWIANLAGKYRRIILLPHYPITNNKEATRVSLYDQIYYYEYIYILNKYINEYKLGNNLVPININRRILDSNLGLRFDYDVYDAFLHELHMQNIII